MVGDSFPPGSGGVVASPGIASGNICPPIDHKFLCVVLGRTGVVVKAIGGA